MLENNFIDDTILWREAVGGVVSIDPDNFDRSGELDDGDPNTITIDPDMDGDDRFAIFGRRTRGDP